MAKEILKNSKIIEKNNYKKCQSKKKVERLQMVRLALTNLCLLHEAQYLIFGSLIGSYR